METKYSIQSENGNYLSSLFSDSLEETFAASKMAVRYGEVASPNAAHYAWVGGPNNAD